MERCEGDLSLGTACLECDRCVAKAKELVLKYGRTPVNKINKTYLRALNTSTMVLTKKLGIREFQKLLRGIK